MINHVTSCAPCRRWQLPRAYFSLASKLGLLVRRIMNRIYWQQRPNYTQMMETGPPPPRSVQEVDKRFVAAEQTRSQIQLTRMERIDKILGTNTYFQQSKIFQERIDSDHIINIQYLQEKFKEPTREDLNWINPQIDDKRGKRNRKKYYKDLRKLRTYPRHEQRNLDLADGTNEATIQFLSKEALYSQLSLKPVLITLNSILTEDIDEPEEQGIASNHYVYFRPSVTTTLFRIAKSLYDPSLLSSGTKLQELAEHLTQVISLDKIYEILQQYEDDQRVAEYLRKIEQQSLEYLLSSFVCDQDENRIAIVIDLLGNKKEFCLFVVSMRSDYEIVREVVFNVKPDAVFSDDSQMLLYVQKSEEGGFTELVARKVETLLHTHAEVEPVGTELSHRDVSGHIIFKCPSTKQLKLYRDASKQCILLSISEYKQAYKQALFAVSITAEQVILLEIHHQVDCRFEASMAPQGLLYAKFYDAKNDVLKYGLAKQYAQEVVLIPWKSHLKLVEEHYKIGVQDSLPNTSSKISKLSLTELDFNSPKRVYQADSNEFIRNVSIRQSHIVLQLSTHAVYNRNRLHFIPHKASCLPHSLHLRSTDISLSSTLSYNYDHQVVDFKSYYCLQSGIYSYTIWKKELKETQDPLLYFETINLNGPEELPLEIQVVCESRLKKEKDMPIIFYCTSRNQRVDEQVLKKLVKKSVCVVEFLGRGTFSTDVHRYLTGAQYNVANQISDWERVIEFLGNHLSTNISLYCKGESAAEIGLLVSLRHPYLFNASVLHNGLYDLQEQTSMREHQHFFGSMHTKELWEEKVKFWRNYNVMKLQFKKPFESKANTQRKSEEMENEETVTSNESQFQGRQQTQKYKIRYQESQQIMKQPQSEPAQDTQTNANPAQKQRSKSDQYVCKIGILQNMVISTTKPRNLHSRLLIQRLRQNRYFLYEQVLLKEYNTEREADLHNLSYLYYHIRGRLERELWE